MVKRHAGVEPLRIEDMIIKVPGRGSLYFKRLKYKGCPKLNPITREFATTVSLIDAGRDDFIRECYQLINVNPTATVYGYFYDLIIYLSWIDSSEQNIPEEGYLAWALIESYMSHCQKQKRLGKISTSDFANKKSCLAWLLRQTNRAKEVIKLPKIKGVRSETNSFPSLDLESEFKPTIKALFRAYNSLLKHFNEGTIPTRHPLYDEDLVEAEAVRLELKGLLLTSHKAIFKKVMIGSHPNKHITEVAMMLTYMFTGMNTTPLANMRISDISFREVKGGKYILDSIKGRARHQQQDNTVGFSIHAKRFIESWISISKKLSNGDENSYLFPYFCIDGRIKPYSKIISTPQSRINKMLARMGFAQITPSKLRKTKSDTLYRITESVYLVAINNNNSIETTARTYIHGTEKEHQKNLSAAMSAKHAIIKGMNISTAVNEAKFNHADILDNYEYEQLRDGQDRTYEARTPTGARCNNNRKGAALAISKSLKRVGIEQAGSEEVCTDFLSCFECKEHALVTDVDDIWLMLSFKDTLRQLQQTPAVNSMPERKYTDLYNTVDEVIKGFKKKNSANYNQALEKLKEAPHPLYSTVYSLNDLLEMYR